MRSIQRGAHSFSHLFQWMPNQILHNRKQGNDISQKIQQFNYYTNGNLKKIQFIYDKNEFKLEMNYLTTNTGQVIGTKANYKRTIQMYHSVLESPTAGFSIGGTATMESQEE